MNREQMIAHLVIHGWEPYSSVCITHESNGMFINHSGMASWIDAFYGHSIGYDWSDISTRLIKIFYQRILDVQEAV